ncbi:MAG: GAF domain-containing protein [Phycisphaerales bacterium]
MPPTIARDYAAIRAAIPATPPGDRAVAMQLAVDLFWSRLATTGVSWIGFYLKRPDADEMILGPRRDKPACSPIGLHGACGRCWRDRTPLIVRDVASLGEGYIACDPRDKSEVILPLLEADGTCWGVLDADSYDVASFDERDAAGLATILRALRLTSIDAGPAVIV